MPPEFTEELTDFRRCMKGTNQKRPRCVALIGEIGQAVSCTIYPQRPSVCREFGGVGDIERCNHVRMVWGLPPIEQFPVLET